MEKGKQTINKLFFLIIYSKIALRTISYAVKMLAVKIFTVSILLQKFLTTF